MNSPGGERKKIRLHFAGGAEPERDQRYRLAGTDLISNRSLDELSPFEDPRPASDPARVPEPARVSDGRDLPVVYEGRGWVGGREMAVIARAEEDRHRVELEDGSAISVSEDSAEVVVRITRGDDPEAARFGALGPGLALALALGDCFSLHASGVVIAGRAVLLLGESGAGKSTMARLSSARAGCERIADDVVPIRVSPEGELWLAPRFPQLKLDHDQQWQGAEEIPCRHLVAIRREPETRSVRFSEFSRRDGVLALLESSVASRLFSKQLRERELDRWVAVAGAHRVVEWRLPDQASRIAESFASLEALLDVDLGPGPDQL